MDDPTVSIQDLVQQFLAVRDAGTKHGSRIFWRDLRVVGAGLPSMPAPTVASYLKNLPNLVNPLTYVKHPPPTRILLHGFSGALEPGELLMVIGQPGSGCTTFLKTLSNLHEEYHQINGDISFGPWSAEEARTRHADEFMFCGEEDIHFPTLTVKETLEFALKGAFGKNVNGKALQNTSELLARLFGLSGVLGTNVGSDAIRGVSGGERRRVSLAEALVTCPSFLAYDNPTSGLDSSTAIEFIQMLREYVSQSGCSAAISLYQGSNPMVPLFDKVIVINSGRQIYYGPVAHAKEYFEELGFYCDLRTSITDFLNSMSAEPEDRQIRDGINPASVPRTAEDFEKAFVDSQIGAEHARAVSKAHEKPQEATEEISKTSSYSLPIWRQIILCFYRQFRIHITDYRTWVVEVVGTVFQSIVLGTIFWNLRHETRSLYSLGSALFYAILVPVLQSMSEFGNTFAQRPILLKQRGYRFYRTLSYGYGQIAADLIWKIVAIACNVPMYWMVNFQRDAGHFFFFFLTAYVAHMCLSVFFRLIAVLSPSMDRAALPVGIALTTMVIYAGWYIPPPNMQVWLAWLRYLNPTYYAFESLMINEMNAISYQCSSQDIVPSYGAQANQVCGVPGSAPGNPFVTGQAYLRTMYGFSPEDKWRNLGINIGLFLVFGTLVGLGMELFKPPAGKLATVFYNKTRQTRGGAEVPDEEKLKSSDISTVSGPVSPNEKSTELAKVASEHNASVSHIFAWRNLQLDLTVHGEKKRLLNSVDGLVKPSLTALMGVSGAGKTTLLNVLAGRSEIGTLTGDIFVDSVPLPPTFRRRMGYVQQQDVHLPTQTVREALRMTAHLRRPFEIPATDKDAYVEEVIEMLDMHDISEALIGNAGAGLNLEQRKRVSIGVELAAKPEILFLDEPTSGLDGQSAYGIVRLLRKLSDAGQNILCTIHQPAAGVIGEFENLLLLVRGGEVAYHGPLGTDCSTAISYFEKNARECGKGENPAEYFLEIVGAGSRNTSTQNWADLWRSSDQRRAEIEEIDSLTGSANSEQNRSSRAKHESLYATPYWYQVIVVCRRAWYNYWREPDYFGAKLWMNAGNALLNGLTFLQMARNQAGVFDRVLSIFMATLTGPPLGLQIEPRFAVFRDIYMNREKAAYAYHWTIFIISAIVTEIPYTCFTALIYWLLWYFPAGFYYDPFHAGYMLVMYECFSVFVIGLAQLCAAWMPSLIAAFVANGFFFMFVNTFAGTLTPRPLTPSGWRWFFNVSPLYYAAEGMTVDALYNLPLTCSSGETYTVYPPANQTCGAYLDAYTRSNSGYVVNPAAEGSCDYCRYAVGEQYYGQTYGYQWTNRDRNVGIVFGFICFNFLAVFLGTYVTRLVKWSALPLPRFAGLKALMPKRKSG